MAGPELDLSGGDAGGEEPEEGEERKPRGESERSQRRHRADIRTRLFSIFERLADSLEGRGDAELAAMVREDARAMVGGLEGLIKRAPGFAPPIMGALAVLEPLIAFGRILRLLGRRLRSRREEAELELEREREHEGHAAPEACEDGFPGCGITVPHRHEAAGIVYY